MSRNKTATIVIAGTGHDLSEENYECIERRRNGYAGSESYYR